MISDLISQPLYNKKWNKIRIKIAKYHILPVLSTKSFPSSSEDTETVGEWVDFREICDELTFTAYKMKNTP
jgi:hypothetical protein